LIIPIYVFLYYSWSANLFSFYTLMFITLLGHLISTFMRINSIFTYLSCLFTVIAKNQLHCSPLNGFQLDCLFICQTGVPNDTCIFLYRRIDACNDLLVNVVNALSLSSFKNLLKSCCLDRFVTIG